MQDVDAREHGLRELGEKLSPHLERLNIVGGRDEKSGLQTIPAELYEAARIDGASAWRQLRSITLPLLSPVLLLVGILTVAGYFQLFAEPYVMTQGGPLQSTVSVLYFMYEEGFKWWNLGSASAVAFVLFIIIFAVTLLQMRTVGRAGAQ